MEPYLAFVAAAAAVFAVYLQIKTLRKMEQQDHDSVAPAWAVQGEFHTPPALPAGVLFSPVDENHRDKPHLISIYLVNVGFGPASDFGVSYESSNGVKPLGIEGEGQPATAQPIFTGSRHKVVIYWKGDAPLRGSLVVTAASRHGYVSTKRFEISTGLTEGDRPIGWVKVQPLG